MVEQSQAAVVQGLMQLHGLGRNKGLAFEGGGDELASVRRQIGDIADGARTGPLGSAEGLAHEVGEVGFAGLTGGFCNLDEHGLHGSGDATVLQDKL